MAKFDDITFIQLMSTGDIDTLLKDGGKYLTKKQMDQVKGMAQQEAQMKLMERQANIANQPGFKSAMLSPVMRQLMANSMGGGSSTPKADPTVESNVGGGGSSKIKQKTKETAKNLSNILNKEPVEALSPNASNEQILGAIYKMMIKVHSYELLKQEEDQNKFEIQQKLAQKRHDEIIKALSGVSISSLKKSKAPSNESVKTVKKEEKTTSTEPKKQEQPKSKTPEKSKETPKEKKQEQQHKKDEKEVVKKREDVKTDEKKQEQTQKQDQQKAKRVRKKKEETTQKVEKQKEKTVKEPPKTEPPKVEPRTSAEPPKTPPPKVGGTPPVPSVGRAAGAIAAAATLPIAANAKPQDKNQSMVYNAFINAGFSKNQAIALTAEVGRENAYSNYALFGQHPDPGNKETNLGFFSWQKERRAKLIDFMKSKNLIEKDEQGRVNFKMTQESLNAQAEFAKMEMMTQKQYTLTKEKFLGNPEINSNEAAQILGTNYIKWRYNDPKFESGHRNRRLFESQIKRKVEENTASSISQSTPDIGKNIDMISKENKELNERLFGHSDSSTIINQNNYSMFQSQQRQSPMASVDDRSAYERKSRG